MHLTVDDILNKTFNVEFKGYNADEVDQYLDLVLEDYQIANQNIGELVEALESLRKELDMVKEDLERATKRADYLDFSNTTEYSNVDLLKRVTRLEQLVLKK